MPEPSCPERIMNHYRKTFGFPEQPLMGVVASQFGEGTNVRAMRIYNFEQERPILLTHTVSRKWNEKRITPG